LPSSPGAASLNLLTPSRTGAHPSRTAPPRSKAVRPDARLLSQTRAG
jgi:hypothetical protein